MVFLFSFAERLIYPAVGAVGMWVPTGSGCKPGGKRGKFSLLIFHAFHGAAFPPRFPLVILGAQRRREYVPRHLRPLSFRFLRGSFRVLVLPGALFSPKILPPEGPGRKISGSLDLRCPFCSRLLALALFAPWLAAHLDAVSVVHRSVENAVGQVGHGDQEPTRFRPERRLLTPERLLRSSRCRGFLAEWAGARRV